MKKFTLEITLEIITEKNSIIEKLKIKIKIDDIRTSIFIKKIVINKRRKCIFFLQNIIRNTSGIKAITYVFHTCV